MKELEPEIVDFGFYFKTNRVLHSMPLLTFNVKEEVRLIFEFSIDDFGNVFDVKFNWKDSTNFCLLVFELEKYLSNVMFKPLYQSLEELPEPTVNYYHSCDYLTDLKDKLDKAELIFVSFG